jgi:hypothetical protein
MLQDGMAGALEFIAPAVPLVQMLTTSFHPDPMSISGHWIVKITYPSQELKFGTGLKLVEVQNLLQFCS